MAALTLFIFSLLVSTTFAIDDNENTDQVVEKEERPAFQALPLQLGGPGERKQFFFSLTYHEVLRGKDSTTITIAEPTTSDWRGQSFGKTVVQDVPLWTNSSQKEVYARWQGVAFQSDKNDMVWHSSVTIKFEYKDLNKSTLQVMGRHAPYVTGGSKMQWAIVGGTGYFTLAQGVIYGNLRLQDQDDVWMDLGMYGYYTPMAEPK